MTDRDLRARLSETLRSVASIHLPDRHPNVFVFTTPRSGSTWLMELIEQQPGFKSCSEPLDLRREAVRRHLGIEDWKALYDESAEPALARYFEGLASGRLGFLNPSPLRGVWRPLTRRIVFKILHGCEDRIDWLASRGRGRAILLLRHPIPVTLSREVLPRLEAFVTSDYRRHFDASVLQRAEEIIASGSALERGVLDWCLQNTVPLRDVGPDWLVLTYEQLVLDPRPVVEMLAGALDLPDERRLLANLDRPSRTVRKSDDETARRLAGDASSERSAWLVSKWRDRVGDAQVAAVDSILDLFGLDAYRGGEVLPHARYWIGGAPPPPPVPDA